MKKAFIIGNAGLALACLTFTESLGITVDKDNYDRNEGETISLGTSKKYTVAGNADPSFYSRKHGITPVVLDKTTVLDFIQSVLDLVTVETPVVTPSVDIEVSVEEPVTSQYNHSAINLLYAKVKKSKKSPKNYFVIDTDGEYSLTTDTTKVSIGNLAEIFAEINAD